VTAPGRSATVARHRAANAYSRPEGASGRLSTQADATRSKVTSSMQGRPTGLLEFLRGSVNVLKALTYVQHLQHLLLLF
jgi:hypothetical protein